MIPVSFIAEKIAPFIQLSWPNDQEAIFSYLSLAQQKIWRAGFFHNSIQHHYVNTDLNGNIITPHGYNILLGCNVNFKPVTITSHYSFFHCNGNGETALKDKNLYTETVFLGNSPVFFQPNDSWMKKSRMFVTVKGQICEERKFSDVSVLGLDGKPIYTYVKETKKGSKIVLCSQEKADSIGVEYRDGVRYAITAKPQFHKNILVSQILGIFKDQTLGPVEYYLTDESGFGRLCARLEPFETRSEYKRYKVSGHCIKKGQILGLFKMSKPVDIVSENQYFLSDNIEAIIAIVKSFKIKNDEEDIQKAQTFMNDGLNSLREEIRGGRVKVREHLQVESNRDFSNIKNFA